MTTETLQPASVPKLAKIVELMGGFDRLGDGGSFVLTDHGAYVYSDKAPDEEWPPSEEMFPEWGAAGHALLPTHINRMWTTPDGTITATVGHWYKQNGDCCHDGNYTFKVTPDGAWCYTEYEFTAGGWYVRASRLGDYVKGERSLGTDGLRHQVEESDRESLSRCRDLRQAEAYAARRAAPDAD
jgi:hypothetical protein